ncbi:MAG: TetR/AcrR family transcriptional regulator [Pseudomonadota bacterium]
MSNVSVELVEKNRPKQQRAIRTYEAILSAASELLCEVGLEKISTNNIAERAGVTVPALYRYFPNKYAVLNALCSRLLSALNASCESWRSVHLQGNPCGPGREDFLALLVNVHAIVKDFPGGLELLHAMQTMAPLKAVRMAGYWSIAQDFAEDWSCNSQLPLSQPSLHRLRMAVETGFGCVLIALEDERLETEFVLGEGAATLDLQLHLAAAHARSEMN